MRLYLRNAWIPPLNQCWKIELDNPGMLLCTLARAFDSSIDEQSLVGLQELCESAASLAVVALSPGSLLSRRVGRVELAYPQAREAFN